MNRVFSLKLALAVSLFFCLAISTTVAQKFAITNVTVISMTQEKPLPGQTVLIERGIITKISPAGNLKLDRSYTTIDATGQYLIPGLFDMHTHFYYEQGAHINTTETELKLMLANGITHARIMAGHPSYLQARENVKAQTWVGPELTVVSPQLVGRWPWSTEFKNFELINSNQQAVDAVKKFKREGYEAIKLTFMVAPEIFDAVVATAREEDLKVVGHVGPLVMLPKALKAKQQIEHMDMFIEMLLPDTSYNHGQSVSDFNIYSKAAWETVPHLDESRIPALAKRVKEAGIYVTPTNAFFIYNAGLPLTDEEIKAKPDYNFLPERLKEEKWKYRASYLKSMAPLEDRKKYVHLRKKMVYELWKAGVPLMAGSDAPEFFVVSGFAIHDELRAMVEAGLTPYAALQTATVNPATFLEIDKRKGTIEVGKLADFLLLDKNPLDDISNTQSIAGMFTQSMYYNREAVAKLMAEARLLGSSK